MRCAGWYGIIVGVLMVGQWAFFLTTGQVPEWQTAPREITFHLIAEGVTALGLLLSGVALLRNRVWAAPAYFVAAGMLLYTVLESPGYVAQRGQWTFVGMFAGLLVLALVSLGALYRSLVLDE